MLTSWLWSLLATAARDTRDYIRFRQYKRRLR